jgi:hypothetical protein
MQRRHVITLGAVLLALAVGAAAQAGETEDQAVEAAKEWLALVDAGEYADSWTEAAEFFRNAVTQAQWEQAVEGVRRPLGAVESRKLKSAQYTTTLPGAPDGQYVVIQFTTTFEHKASAVETVTSMKDPDGVWRVAGYFVK